MPPGFQGTMGRSTLSARSDHFAQDITKGTFDGKYSPSSVIATLSLAIAYYNSLEIILLVFSTFRRFKGLYFWTMTLCNVCVILYSMGMMLLYFELCIKWLGKFVLDIGWAGMLLFQSLVLYSRLNLIIDDIRIIQGVKWMIIATAVLVFIPVLVLDFGMTYGSPAFDEGYYYIEPIQMIWITIQELLISGLYIWKTIHFLNVTHKKALRSMIWQLFTINTLIILMDIGLVVLQFLHYQLYQESLKGFVYSVKLKLELNILSKLVDLVHMDSSCHSMALDGISVGNSQGQAQDDLRKEMDLSNPSSLGNRTSNDTRDRSDAADHGPTSLVGASTTSPRLVSDKEDEISQVATHQSGMTPRTTGRESDMMYAEMLRSLSR